MTDRKRDADAQFELTTEQKREVETEYDMTILPERVVTETHRQAKVTARAEGEHFAKSGKATLEIHRGSNRPNKHFELELVEIREGNGGEKRATVASAEVLEEISSLDVIVAIESAVAQLLPDLPTVAFEP